jgi:hypothetical protein
VCVCQSGWIGTPGGVPGVDLRELVSVQVLHVRITWCCRQVDVVCFVSLVVLCGVVGRLICCVR